MSTVRFNTQFPGYEVLSELGRSNARVLKARHLATGDLVAIKHFALNTDADTLRRFQQESTIMTSIDHPNIVRIREVQLDAELPYIVMELIEGGSLRHLLKGMDALDVPTTTRLGLQLASAFNAFHPQGIVHRDLKPENILYRHLPSGELHFLLTDFGVARLNESSNTLTGQSLMTYEYASPEQFSDPRQVGIATDYYSLGVVLYECLTGSVPFAMGDQAGIVTFMNRVLNDAPPALTMLPNGRQPGQFAPLMQGLLAKKAGDRINDPDELTWLLKQAELDYLQAGRTGLSAVKSAVPKNTTPPAKTSPRAGTAAAVAPMRDVPAKKASGTGLKLLALGLLVALVGAGIYYFSTLSTPTFSVGKSVFSDSATASDNPETPVKPTVDSAQIRRAEEARRRERLRQQLLTAARNLSVEVTNYRVGLVGGISDVELELSNPSPVTFTSVVVMVKYIKEKGGVFKSEKVYFTDVGPYSSPVRNAPDSDRGTRITCKILASTLPDSLMLPDSSDDSTSLNPLN